MERMKQRVKVGSLARKIYLFRGHRVMIDRDLADLYDVQTKALNRAVRRNADRFPRDFMFQLTLDEASRCQFGTLKRGKNIKYLPLAFSEQGVAMLAGVLSSARAVEVNIAIMRAFVRLREMIAANKDLAQRLSALEEKYDEQFRVVFDAIRDLMDPPEKPLPRIGFKRQGPAE